MSYNVPQTSINLFNPFIGFSNKNSTIHQLSTVNNALLLFAILSLLSFPLWCRSPYSHRKSRMDALRAYMKQRNKTRLTTISQASTSAHTRLTPSVPLPPFPSAPLPSAPFPSAPLSRSATIVEVDIEITNTPNLLTVTQNHNNECRSPSVTSLPPYDIAVTDGDALPTYQQAIARQNNI